MVIDCATAFLNQEFKVKLDSNFSLIGCKNGVYDFNLKKLRPGRPSDYITMSTHRNFVDRDVSLEDIVPINEFLTDVLVDPEVITCLLATFCLSLRGVQHAKFFMWTGVGANGKSKLAHLLRNALGDYGVILPVQVVTSKRIENGKPMPEMSQARNTQFAAFSEPCTNEVLNSGAIKEICGGDSMYNRTLYSEGSEMTCRFIPVLLCNDKPECNDQSEGMGRRMRVFNFPVQFKQFPDPKKYPYEKKLDDTIDQMIEEQADLFMTWCLTAGIEYVERVGMKYPESVLNETQSYRNDCDWVSQFRQEFITKTFNEKDTLRWNTVLTAATTYYKAHCTGRLPRVVDLRKMFEKALGEKLHNWEWKGWLMPGNCSGGF